jgi:hypothetical protein
MANFDTKHDGQSIDDQEGWEPYLPPCAGDGPIDRPGRDICFRINSAPGCGERNRMVTPQVLGAVAWMLNWGKLNRKERQRLLDDLGLEFRETPMGGSYLAPAHIPQPRGRS